MGRGRIADIQRIEHIKLYCEDTAEFIERFGRDFSVFSRDRAYHNAVAMCIMQIGGLANGLSEAFREETEERVQWKQIRSMRNWIAHAYAEVSDDKMWEAAVNDVPALLKFCEEILTAEAVG